MEECTASASGDRCSDNPDVLLLFPPQWTPVQPYLSLPSLTAYLRAHGIRVRQCDLNIEFYDAFYSEDHLRKVGREVQGLFYNLDRKPALDYAEQTYYYSTFLVRDACEEVVSRIDDLRGCYKDVRRFFSIREYGQNRKLLNVASNLLNIYYRIRLSLEDLDFDIRWESLAELEKLLSSARPESPLAFFENQVSAVTQDRSPAIVGISINGPSQLVPGLTMARWLKRCRPEIHVSLGGNLLSRCASALATLPRFFESFADSVVLLEGELPLLRLVEAVSDSRSLDAVPNLLYLDRTVRQSPLLPPVAADQLPTPDFDDFDLDRYWSPCRLLPILSSRGCCWNRCTFCDHSFIYGGNFRQRAPELVVEDLKRLKDKHGTTLFSFSDEALTPAAARKISEIVLGGNLEVALYTQARMEKSFSPEICRLMAHAGFKMVFIGLESGCKETLARIRKGVDLDAAPEILRRFHEAGIFVHLFAFFGFPGETQEGIEATIRFVKENQENIFSVGASAFVLGKFSPVGLHPEQYGVRILKERSKELSCSWEFEYLTGQTHKQAEEARDRFNLGAWEDLPYGPVYSEMPREHMFMYVMHYSPDQLLEKCAEWQEFKNALHHAKTARVPVRLGDIPILKDGVFLSETGFDILQIRDQLKDDREAIVRREPGFFVYNLLTQNTAKISPSGFATLLLCDGHRTVLGLAEMVTTQVARDGEEVQAKVRDFIGDMVDRGFLIVRE